MTDRDSLRGASRAGADDGGDIGPPLVSMQKGGSGGEPKDDGRRMSTVHRLKQKNSIVMTEAAVKELQKQLRANKDERRQTMDLRYNYIFSMLSDTLGIDMTSVEDQVLADDKSPWDRRLLELIMPPKGIATMGHVFCLSAGPGGKSPRQLVREGKSLPKPKSVAITPFPLIDDLFIKNGQRKLMFYYQEMPINERSTVKQKKLFITSGSTESLSGICCIFLRTDSTKEVTVANVHTELSYMWMDCTQAGGILEGVENMMSNIFTPALRSQNAWGTELAEKNGLVSDFLDSLDNFNSSLSGVQGNMSGQVTLKETEQDEMIKSLRTATDYQAAANSGETLDQLEKILLTWMKQIEQVLTESEQIRREADNVGPSAELVYWRCRMTSFNSLLEQINSPRCRNVLGVLIAGRSKSIQKWKALDARITDAANEAKDNVKYLYTLDNLFGPLVKCNPSTILEVIPSIINAVRMIYSISTYYNTSEQMTSLFVKVTNQMITMCKAYLNDGVQRLWDHPHPELKRRIKDCITLNEAYQRQFHKTKEKLRETPTERQFQFSENYIFGKFDTFARRLMKISDMLDLMDSYAPLNDIKVDGVGVLATRYKNIIEGPRKKTYDILDHRKQEFDADYIDFREQFDALLDQTNVFIDSWFERNLTTEQSVDIVSRFEVITDPQLDLADKYRAILRRYAAELDEVRRLYQTERTEPVAARNLPPISGRIAWARQLYRRIDQPMKVFKQNVEILKSDEGRKIVRNYNKMATVLIEYEVLYHRAWNRAVELARSGLNASLLVRHPETGQLYVNFDPQILELLQETKYIAKFGLEVHESAKILSRNEESLKKTQERLHNMLSEYRSIVDGIPICLAPLMKPYFNRVEKALEPGLNKLSWTSVKIDEYLMHIYAVLGELSRLSKASKDTLECRIDAILDLMSSELLCVLPEDEAVPVQEFLSLTERRCYEACNTLTKHSQTVESALKELVDSLKEPLSEEELRKMLPSADSPSFTREPDAYTMLMNYITQKNTDTFVKCTKMSLEAIRKRLQSNRFLAERPVDTRRPLLKVEIILSEPNVVMTPTLEDVQAVVSKAVQAIMKMSEDVPQWEHQIFQQKQQQKLYYFLTGKELDGQGGVGAEGGVDDVKGMNFLSFARPLVKIVSDNKDIMKTVLQLNSIVTTNRPEVTDLLANFCKHDELWKTDIPTRVREFMAQDPIMSEYDLQMKYYAMLESQISEMPQTHRVGPLLLVTDPLKASLVVYAKSWTNAYGSALNDRCGKEMDEILTFFETMHKPLKRPVKDLDDIRTHMAALTEIREAEVRIDMTIAPIEEAYMMLAKYNLVYNDGNAERVDTLSYRWRLLKQKASECQNHLMDIQPEFRANLIDGVKTFKINLEEFIREYTEQGPMVEGIAPREASDRLNVFQMNFDELWRKYQTYSGGEELFGLEVTEYSELQRIRKELNLLQKLYQLYNSVLERVHGYYDISWVDLNIDKINGELIEFQNKCRKLPKALKEWQAYEDLRKTIDDFNETCPLLELMANRAMQERHWERIAKITNHTFDVQSDSFLLRNIMEAPLLANKEEIEDICISATKEKDIEAKLKVVINDWSLQNFSFANFKSRGELLLKGDTISETVALMEDSLMVLGSLLSNRYNAPFRARIQEWVHKLTSTTEIIENWMIVQNLWIYLEAVFVGGDIAKQLPQEAKRFSNIDKSWLKIMGRAHDVPNVVQCCTGDETLAQLLPHLLEQLEICQKSLTGYLEKKRLLFPRFFFVSDPALLEILGQASDSHTIQAHLLSVFDNTKTVVFDDKVYDRILAINSQEGESVELKDAVMATGNVENWLADLLKSTRASVHAIIRAAASAILEPGFKLLEFENAYPAQVGLLGIQMIWTAEAEAALQAARYDKKIMASTNQRFLTYLNELINVTTTDLTKNERTKFETLVTIYVHQKDIFDDLVKQHIKSPTDFEWLKQSRFYFREDDDKCAVCITDVTFTYMNEYLGCTERLVITPLTDRCYITLAQALGMSLGGAPAGPAGTGKTETVKDMGRCLGKFVVVFNCSDQMDYRGLGRIFKGLAQSGSWGCFDEFNRIDLPVLSVAAQQIAIVLAAKKEHRTEFIFTDGDTVSLDHEFGIFLTMNPGYAGRQELPENLKILFRTVAMMVPDRAIIIRVKLASCGFQQNIVLAKKFFTLYKLCEEQLSKQVHYDFGLRNILSVLRTLGSTKRANPQDGEPTTVMRVLRDMNLSKLVDEDEPLFMSLIEDLFPGMTLDKGTYPDIEAAIQNQVREFGLIQHPPWILKLIQLYETQRVRHGMMALGPAGAGKTQCIRVLMRAMTDCGEPHKEMRMNPKAITAPQMFGRLDVATNDWTDGIFSTLWRRTHKTKKGDHIWLLLDGPVDAIWIENLNSVLDDNKTLTLANGDRIPMSPNCKIIFEVHNIDNASPATVSRNGMVFMSSSVLDWNPILKGWLLKRPPNSANTIFNIFERLWPDVYQYVLQDLNPKMDVLECMYIKQALNLLEGLLGPGDDKEMTTMHLEKLIIFTMMWSIGALLEIEDRRKMAEFLTEHPTRPQLPPVSGEDTIFEYLVNEKGQWEHWRTKVPEYEYPRDSVPDYLNILVPNVDNVRTEFLIQTIAKQSKAVLLIGEQGSAKTVMIQGYCSKFDPETTMFKSFNFSSASTPLMFQRTIESYVDKRMGTTYGPPAGKKMTVFVDDINMPIINEWGDQVTNEITRQMMEARGFYNLEKPGEFTNIVDVQMMGAMIHPGGGRNDIPQRLKRHFDIFNCTLPSNASIDKVFRTIGCGYFISERKFTAEVTQLVEQLVPATRKLWQKVKVKMLPTPAKFHYVFNLRDLSRIWQGMVIALAEVVKDTKSLISLWKHECQRVIADRFTTQDDKDWFERTMKTVVDEECGAGVCSEMSEEPYYVDFLRDAPEATGDEPDDAEMDTPKIYEPINDFQQLSDRLQFYQSQLNESVRGANMDLVFFKDAMTNLVKISRVIRTPKGHALLVGVGGSGKQSLTRLASFIAGYKTFQITLTRSYNVSNLMEDLKYLYRTSGLEGKGITFIFTDNEIKDEAFLEYMNNVLSSGEVSNLFARDEMDEILQELTVIMKKEFPRRPPTNENLAEYYMSRVKRNLHVALCFSPVGEKFRSRSLKFPGLISGCTMDWFQRWPKDALIAVSNHFLASYEIVCSAPVKQSVVQVMGEFQDMVAEMCSEYFQRFRRQTHVTPKSYLSFIAGYKTIYDSKRKEIGQLKQRMSTGLEKLIEATASVNELSKELVLKEKELAVASKKADVVLIEVTSSARAAEEIKVQVQKVKDKAQKIVDEISVDKVKAEAKLEAAKPALEEAEAALQTIKPVHIATVRRLANPPHLIMRIMDCVVLLFQRHVDTVTMDSERHCVKPSWAEALKVMAAGNFLQALLTFPKDTINEETVELMKPYLEADDYNIETARRVCGDVAGLASWTTAMVDFFGINKEVLPMKANLAIQEARYESAMKDLNKAQATLDEKQRELDVVQALYDQAMREKQTLVDDANACRRKMNNATTLIDGLSGERERWTEAMKGFEAEIGRLVGDVLLSTGFLSYSGPFNQEFRNQMFKSWKKEMIKKKIPYTDELNVTTMLVDNATITEWNLQGLPSDELSIQNGLIVTKATRYPLLIDPQGQGKQWIKNREGKSELQVTNLNHKYFRSHLEDALSLGRPLLIEDVGEELDPALDNVLEKNFIRSGSSFKVKVGDKEVDVMASFRLYMTTKLGNPLYTPEVSAKTSIIDFTVTIRGLEDQLLGLVILTEKKELEAERTKLLEEVTANKRKTKELEDNLLYRLTSTKGSLVEDESLIEVLRVTKATAHDVSEKLATAAETEIRINNAREEFRPVATRGSVLYFLIVEMGTVNTMYQTSLRQFLQVFDNAMARSVKSPLTSKRIPNIIDYLTWSTFAYTVRGLYEKDKFIFTILMTLKIQLQAKQIRSEEFQCFIKGGAALDLNAVEPKPKKWISDMTWLNLVELSKLGYFSQILSQVSKNDKGWKDWFDSEAPEESVIPDGYNMSLSTFHRLLLIRSWCPDRTLPMAKLYVTEIMGKQYAEGVILDMEVMWSESTSRTPLICFLSMGSDPTENIERLSKAKGLRYNAISMGQGQEVHARRVISASMLEGGWVLLQNCHLGLDYMDELLDTIISTESVHDTFRLWITTEVHPKFPINLLQTSIKFTAEPPQGVKAGLKRTYGLITQDQLDISNMPQWKPILYDVAFLHTTVQERRKFGPIGWNIPYEFNQSDFTSTIQFVQNHLDEIDVRRGLSWTTIRYMIGEVQYGGRVTDDYDKRLLITYSKVWFGENIFADSFQFAPGYTIPTCKTLEEYKSFIETLPAVDSPDAFGLHPNADITYQTNMANEMLDTIVNIQPKDASGSGGETRESVVYKLADDMLQKLPEDYIPHEVRDRLKRMGLLQPLNIFLRQEIDRMQKIITLVRNTLKDLKLAIDGTIVMSENLRDALDCMYDARIPNAWKKISWESSTLGFWFTDLLDRSIQFNSWLYEGRPNVFWMTGFFNPQGFLTAMRQEIARAHKNWALDAVVLDNDITKNLKEDITSAPPEGVYIHGLYLDGAGWDRRNSRLTDPSPKVLYTALPVVHVYAINGERRRGPTLYECPVYKKPRRTDLTYIFPLLLKTTKDPDHWILRGVALLCDTK